MTTTAVPRRQTYRPSESPAQVPDVRAATVSQSAADLLATLAALPARHPSRRALRVRDVGSRARPARSGTSTRGLTT